MSEKTPTATWPFSSSGVRWVILREAEPVSITGSQQGFARCIVGFDQRSAWNAVSAFATPRTRRSHSSGAAQRTLAMRVTATDSRRVAYSPSNSFWRGCAVRWHL